MIICSATRPAHGPSHSEQAPTTSTTGTTSISSGSTVTSIRSARLPRIDRSSRRQEAAKPPPSGLSAGAMRTARSCRGGSPRCGVPGAPAPRSCGRRSRTTGGWCARSHSHRPD
ncbi:hypothetical protein G6F24_017231 [Rhizopus arrhizus]|nr:hypothetical protein G6F24_017231 [Rhizopus arrhizus]